MTHVISCDNRCHIKNSSHLPFNLSCFFSFDGVVCTHHGSSVSETEVVLLNRNKMFERTGCSIRRSLYFMYIWKWLCVSGRFCDVEACFEPIWSEISNGLGSWCETITWVHSKGRWFESLLTRRCKCLSGPFEILLLIFCLTPSNFDTSADFSRVGIAG